MKFIKSNLNNQAVIEPSKEQEAKPIWQCQVEESLSPNPQFSPSKSLQKNLQGKRLPLNEIPYSPKLIHSHYLNGFIRYQKGIEISSDKYQCIRCGNEDQQLFGVLPCARCDTDCVYCRKCINMGRLSACTPLISWCGPPISSFTQKVQCTSKVQLSSGQQEASNKVVQAIKQKSKLLVWAVCGSGKTEVLFQGIEYALNHNLNLCIATPRTDVVLELGPRMKEAFPTAELIALYGGSEDRGNIAPFVLSTTHQLLRFYRYFDVIIIDEVDAFPYSVEPMLTQAVQQALKAESALIYLTATPDQAFTKQEELEVVTIPARYHRYSLPVPIFHWCGNWQKGLSKKRLPPNVLKWIQKRLQNKKQTFLFVPQVKILKQVVQILRHLDKRIEGVHAADNDRKAKVERFRNGESPILVTTTILERGVTVSNIDVAVLGAEDRIFTESALVQIAGRAGRKANYPTGDVVYFHYGKTNEMVKAKQQIERMNKEALQKGLIDR
ncbi:DEAD/DEAH box helicase [Bacillus tianshenii]|nr:DEAD/DEAH box helicase [Bacillus tianshenii]